jgi:hypothetical protein
MNNKDAALLFRKIGADFQRLSELFCSLAEDTPQMPDADAGTETPAEPAETAGTAPSEDAQTQDKPKTYSKEDVRVLLKQKATEDDCKHKTEVKALVCKYSSDGTLTSVPEEKYAELMAELEVIGNA